MMSFSNVVIGPYGELMRTARGGSPHKGGPRWPDWESSREARHHRAGKPVDAEPSIFEPEATIDEAAWGGAVTLHFGHQIADFSMRLLETTRTCPGVPILFATDPRYAIDDLTQAPPWLGPILDWFGIPRDARHLVTVPSLVRTLHVVPQAEQLFGPGPSREHLDRMDALVRERLGEAPTDRTDVTYLSRAGQAARFAGEGYLERVLADAGVAVVRPESLDLPLQLRRYRSSRWLIAAEGSALHGLQLMGRIPARLTVLNRRPRARLAEASLRPRVARLTYADVTGSLLHGLRPNGRPATNYGIAVLNVDALLETFDGAGVGVRAIWDQGAYLAERDHDIREWIDREAARRRSHSAASLEHILATLDAPGLEPFRAEAAASLRPR